MNRVVVIVDVPLQHNILSFILHMAWRMLDYTISTPQWSFIHIIIYIYYNILYIIMYNYIYITLH